MSRTETLAACGADGKLLKLSVKISVSPPWTLEYDWSGQHRSLHDTDLFEALREMRKELEDAGYQLLCAGARPDVAPSGMSRDMGGGRKAYVLHLSKPGSRDDMVDIFDAAEPASVGTVQQQREYFEKWKASLGAD